MTICAVFVDSHGRIERICRGDTRHLEMWEAQGAILWDGPVDPVAHWFSGGVKADRPHHPGPDRAAITADGVDRATLAPLPVGAAVRVTGPGLDTADTVADGAWEFATTVPGTYRIALSEAFPYLDAAWEITAAPPPPDPNAPPPPYVIAKSTAVRRILAQGKAADADALLSDPSNVALKLLWDAITVIESDHPDTATLRAMLSQIDGLDVDAVLAPE